MASCKTSSIPNDVYGENDFIPDVTDVLQSHGNDTENDHDLKLEFGHP